jgi:hypothetical protein
MKLSGDRQAISGDISTKINQKPYQVKGWERG